MKVSIYWLILIAINALDYYQNFRAAEVKASELRAQLAQAQLHALKMQLHPHFLFNTLNSISALLHTDIEAADEMVARLGDFLRLTLENSGDQEVTLEQEIAFLRCYLEIETSVTTASASRPTSSRRRSSRSCRNLILHRSSKTPSATASRARARPVGS
jgi:hypothetical protein